MSDKTIDRAALRALLPAILLERDARPGTGALDALLEVLARSGRDLEREIEALYDDLFIETCAPWVVPYLGQLVGVEHVDSVGGAITTPRVAVAETLAYRRRKGTAGVLAQLARDLLEQPAIAVEAARRLVVTPHAQGLHPRRPMPDARTAPRTASHAPVESLSRMPEARRPAAGRLAVPTVDVFVFPVRAEPLLDRPLVPDGVRSRHLSVDPFGRALPLYLATTPQERFSPETPWQSLPLPITRTRIHKNRDTIYGTTSLRIHESGVPVPAESIRICALEDAGGWAAAPDASEWRVDPERGRVIAPVSASTARLRVDACHAYFAPIGGGAYPRDGWWLDEGLADEPAVALTRSEAQPDLAPLSGVGADVVEIAPGTVYGTAGLTLRPSASARLAVRASPAAMVPIVLGSALVVEGGTSSTLVIEGLWLRGAPLRITGGTRRVVLRHVTCDRGSVPIEVENDAALEELVIVRSSVGRITAGRAHLRIEDSVVHDGGDDGTGIAIDGAGELSIVGSTVVGRARADRIGLVSNALIVGRVPPSEATAWPSSLSVRRLDVGCVRFSAFAPDARLPMRTRCVELSGATMPAFVSLTQGHPCVARLTRSSPATIRQGADDGGELGAHHFLERARRERLLGVLLEDHLRLGNQYGVFDAT